MLTPYARLLRAPGAAQFCAAGVVARLPIAMYGLGYILLVAEVTGSYALAGVVSAGYALSVAVGSPLTSRLADRIGQARVLPWFTTVHVACLIGSVIALLNSAPLAVGLALASLAGATQLGYGGFIRARWVALIRTRLDATGQGSVGRATHTAFALESVLDEVIFVLGPPLATLLVVALGPGSAVLASALIVAVGAAWLTRQPQTAPPVLPHTGPRHRAVIRQPGLAGLVVVFALFGALFGAMELSTVAFAGERNQPAMAGVLLALYAVGSLVAGLIYGTRHLRTPLPDRLLWASVLVFATTLVMPFITAAWALGVMLMLAGSVIAPTLITGYALIERVLPPRQLTEGLAWSISGLGVGIALVAPLAGWLIDRTGASAGYATAATAGGLMLLAVTVLRPWLARADTSDRRADPVGASSL
ncbi:MAG: MFS transporter [Actinomycetales bacterium]|nr:MFS transporter [Actinomycetales bacterium]